MFTILKLWLNQVLYQDNKAAYDAQVFVCKGVPVGTLDRTVAGKGCFETSCLL